MAFSRLNNTDMSDSLTRLHYRADIDGLRAVAVIGVVGYHAFPSWIKSGFIGVDVFFVISGFLISKIIFEKLAADCFSFTEFFTHRIRRIFPALIIVLFANLVVGWYILLADEYKLLGRHIAGSASFIQNLILLSEKSYFSSGAETRPLLHLWTLAVEEQFYIIWPLFLWVAWRFKLSFPAIITLTLTSFILNLTTIKGDAETAFYSLHTRFWELSVGSVLAYLVLFHKNKLSKLMPVSGNILSFCGATLLAIGIFSITKESLFPGWWALLPTIGTALIILANSRAWLNRVILSNRILVWFGLISYPLYLWHWSLLSFANINESGSPSRVIRLAIVLISILLAWLTYRVVEQPIRFGNNNIKKTMGLILSMMFVFFVGFSCDRQNGFEGTGFRNVEKTNFSNFFENSKPNWKYSRKIRQYENYRDDCNFGLTRIEYSDESYFKQIAEISKSCYERNFGKKTLFIWGDSHAQLLYSGLNNNLPEDWQILIIASSSCIARFDNSEKAPSDYCGKSNWLATKSILKGPTDAVIIAQANGHNFDDLRNLGDLLLENGVSRVVFTGPVPHWTADLPKIIVRKLWDLPSDRTFVGVNYDVVRENELLRKRFQNVESFVFVDLIGFFCNDVGCITRVGNDRQNEITTWDYGHLTPLASDFLAKNLLARIVFGD